MQFYKKYFQKELVVDKRPNLFQMLSHICCFQDEVTLKFDSGISFILCVSTAYDNTFVVLKENMWNAKDKIIILHLDEKGKVLFERPYRDQVRNFGMMNDREVIMLNMNENKIDIINLKNYTVTQINLEGQNYLMTQMKTKIFTFSQTKLFGIPINSQKNKSFIYYLYEGIQTKSSPLVKVDTQLKHDSIHKIDDHSKIGWYNSKSLMFFFFDLKDSLQQGKYSIVIIINPVKQMKELNNGRFRVKTFWEIKPDIYFLGVQPYIQTWFLWASEDLIYLIVDASSSDKKVTFRKAKFLEDLGFDKCGDCFRIGDFSVFHITNQREKNPFYIVSNETEQVVYQDTWRRSYFYVYDQYFFPGWEPCLIQYLKSNEKITVLTTKIVDIKSIYLDMMLWLNQNFDDDLLQDAVQSLTEE